MTEKSLENRRGLGVLLGISPAMKRRFAIYICGLTVVLEEADVLMPRL
jgi:hypothetical protein